MYKVNNNKQLSKNSYMRLSSHKEQHLLFFISTPDLMLGLLKGKIRNVHRIDFERES